MDFYTILKQYIGPNRTLYYESKLIHFIRSNKIDKYIQNNLISNIQYGGKQYSTTIDDLKIKFDYYINETDDNTIIYISDTNDKTGLKYCAMLTYSNQDILNIGLIETPIRCINIQTINKSESKDIINNKLKYGDLMMKAIINFSKDNGFKKIHLDDISRFNCIDSKKELSYSLLHVHILTDGYPWYYKYGFKFIFQKDHQKIKSNKKIIQNKLTKDLGFDTLITFIYDKAQDIISIEIIGHILKLYTKYKDEPLNKFLKKFTRSYCDIMSYIYMDIYHYFDLESFDTNSMELIL